MAGRITIADIVMTLFGIAILVGLYPVYNEYFQAVSPELDPATRVAFQVVIPMTVVILLALLSSRALGGAS